MPGDARLWRGERKESLVAWGPDGAGRAFVGVGRISAACPGLCLCTELAQGQQWSLQSWLDNGQLDSCSCHKGDPQLRHCLLSVGPDPRSTGGQYRC